MTKAILPFSLFPKKILVIGASGQDGYYLEKLVCSLGAAYVGTSRKKPLGSFELSKYGSICKVLEQVEPEYIFHLAANSTTSHHALFENHKAISTGTCNVLEAARLYAPHARIFIAGSAVQFANTGNPIDEFTPFMAGSPYAAERIYATYLARYYRETFGLRVYVGYFFNHDSPLRGERHVNQKIVRAAQRIAAGSNEKLTIGDINVCKEFMYAGDAVNAAWILVNQDEYFEAVIGTGEAYSIAEWLDICFKSVGLHWKEHVEIDSSHVPQYNILVSNPKRIREMGWHHKLSLNELALLMMNGRR